MLTTKQFINKAEELGYDVETGGAGCSEYEMMVSDCDKILFSISEDSCYMNVHVDEFHSDQSDVLILASEYISTPAHERKSEDKYYIYWTDLNGLKYFLDDNCLREDKEYGNNSEFDSLKHLIECEGDDIYHYQFTESDIKKIPKQWRPLEFGGIGFTQAIIV